MALADREEVLYHAKYNMLSFTILQRIKAIHKAIEEVLICGICYGVTVQPFRYDLPQAPSANVTLKG